MPYQKYSKSSKTRRKEEEVSSDHISHQQTNENSCIMKITFWSRTCMQTHFKLIELQLFPLKFTVQASAEESFELNAMWIERVQPILTPSQWWSENYLDQQHRHTHKLCTRKHIFRVVHTEKKAINLRESKIEISQSGSQNASDVLLLWLRNNCFHYCCVIK